MGIPTLFFIAFIIITIYIVLGNYLYLIKVLPYLSQNPDFDGASFLPSLQSKHLKRYAEELEREGVYTWLVLVAKHNKKIDLVVFVAALLLVGGALLI